MRIIDEFSAGDIKVTVFKMNERVSIKFEYNLLEQIYKFRDGSGIDSSEMARRYCTDETIMNIKEIFHQMSQNRFSSLQQLFENDAEEKFDKII